MPFEFQRLDIPDLILVKPRVFRDQRGFFLETYKQSDFSSHGISERFVQDNHSRSTRGVLRGLHYQKPPQAQGKLVRVIRGRVFDVAVDIRRGSPTYKQWTSAMLSEETAEMLYIPPGFAHGFCVLSDVADFAYKVTAEYASDLDAGIRWDDPEIGVEWPVAEPIVSAKDASLPLLDEADIEFEYEAL
jgi:dTDP-4-dehydrorhamnose 3,5-epimerase